MRIVKQIDVLELKKKLDGNIDLTLIDIRESSELAICKIKESIHIPMMDIPNRLHTLDKKKKVIIQCKSGARSARVCEFLMHSGFQNVQNLKGGILDWIRLIDPSQPTY